MWTQKLNHLKKNIDRDRQLIYNGFILCSAKLLIISDKLHSKCVTNERQDRNGSTEEGWVPFIDVADVHH